MKLGPTEETLTEAEEAPLLLTLPVTSVHVWLADSGSIRTETIFRNRNVEPKETGVRDENG
jgi:hypothetical protein